MFDLIRDILNRTLLKIKSRFPAIVAIGLGGYFGMVAILLIYKDFPESYPYMYPDSWSWLNDASYYAGQRDLQLMGRNPGLPLLAAALIILDLLFLLPIVNVVMIGTFLWAMYQILTRLGISRNISAVTILIFSMLPTLHTFSFAILADIYALAFISLSLLCFFIASQDKSNKYYLYAVFFAFLSANFQFAVYLLGLAYLFYILILKRDLLKNKFLMLGGLGLSWLIGWWYAWRYFHFGDPNYSKVIQWELISFNLEGLQFYTFNYLAVFSIPVVVISVLGVWAVWNKHHHHARLILLFLLINVVFWIFLYSWLDTRFFLYMLIPIMYLFGRGITMVVNFVQRRSFKYKNFLIPCLICICLFYIQYVSYPPQLGASICLVPGIRIHTEYDIRPDASIAINSETINMRVESVSIRSFWIINALFERYDYIKRNPIEG